MFFSSPLPYLKDAGQYFSVLRELPWPAWIDGDGGRFDILVAHPWRTLLTQGEETLISDANGNHIQTDNPFNLLKDVLGTSIESIPGVPFSGGALGYWGYDLLRTGRVRESRDTQSVPDMAIGIYDWAVIIDHHKSEARLVSHQRHQETIEELPRILSRLISGIAVDKTLQENFQVCGKIYSNITPADYRQAFQKIQNYLIEGDCYQVNFAQMFFAKARGDALAAYLALREISPAPHSAFLDFPDVKVLSASPERFLKVTDRAVETKPIKGTRRRSGVPQDDSIQIQELQRHPKDRAENLMIVDLLRNDISKTCEVGSVKTPKLFDVESFSNVHHLVSTVIGKLRDDCDALDLLQGCFPGGSITGAPKQRAIEIIDELEPHSRGVYCGAIGYVGYDGNMDTNIAIRTLVYSQGEIRCWVGGGIVADSRCDAEYQETLDKASAMLELLQRFGGKLEKY
ncbi:MAG: aminodeoxychorismate synthase component I [Sideroxydans sp.]|nr:aminodeoxychorismate synthase component I [Sideroxydans sp.]